MRPNGPSDLAHRCWRWGEEMGACSPNTDRCVKGARPPPFWAAKVGSAAPEKLRDGKAVRVTDYWGEPTETPEWRRPLTDKLDMPGDGIWPDAEHLGYH